MNRDMLIAETVADEICKLAMLPNMSVDLAAIIASVPEHYTTDRHLDNLVVKFCRNKREEKK